MHCNQPIHPALAGILQFEEQRLGIPVEVNRRPLYRAPTSPFRPVMEVRIPTGTQPETFPILLEDELLEITAPTHVEANTTEVGFRDATGRLCPLAGVTGNVTSLYFDVNEVFQYPDKVRRRPTNGTVATGNPGNKVADLIFSQAFAVALGNIRRYDWKKETEEFTRHVMAARERTVEEWRAAYRNNERELEEKEWEVRRLAEKNLELRQRIRLHDLLTRKQLQRKAREDHSGLVKLLGRGLGSIEVEDGAVRAVTAPVEILWCGVTYEMGRYIISIPLGEGRLTIKSQDGQEAEGYPHPHVSTDGTPCLGNLGATVAQLLGEGEHFQLVTTLLEFLRSYNPDNPYLRLERWDPDWQDDDDRFDSCYDNASLSDCATCNDDDCHHLDGAQSRCYEYSDTNDCIECAGCRRRRDAIDHCRERHESHQCVTCETDCTYAGDVEACFEAHAGENCTDCPNDDCIHHEENHDETNS
jgi:hypothetical protein